jgi:hypothetical protein
VLPASVRFKAAKTPRATGSVSVLSAGRTCACIGEATEYCRMKLDFQALPRSVSPDACSEGAGADGRVIGPD